MNTINIEMLSEVERKELLRTLAADEKAKKKQREEDKVVYKKLSEEYVKTNIDTLINFKTSIDNIGQGLFLDYAAIKGLKAKVYGEKTQDSHTSTLSDGSASITIGYNVSIGFDGTESAGVEKIKNYISSLAANDENTLKLTKMVNTFLKPNSKTKMLNPTKIIELNRLRKEFNDSEFDEGLDIIIEAQFRRQNSMYVSGWKVVDENGVAKKQEFRFTV